TFSEESFEAEVLCAHVPVLVHIWTEGCGGCQTLGRFVDVIAHEYLGRAKVGKLDAMSNINLAKKFDVRTLPTVLLFKRRTLVDRRTGLISLLELCQMVDSHMESIAGES